MPSYYFDTSAVLKKYRLEQGTTEVRRLVNEPGAQCLMSRLTVTEVQRAFAQFTRGQEISADDAIQLCGIFYTDLRARRFRVVQLKTYHHHTAVRIFYQYIRQPHFPLLRTADAIQLAGALRLHDSQGLDYFVAADIDLCVVAEAEGLSVINPKD